MGGFARYYVTGARVSTIVSLGDRARQHGQFEQSLRCMSLGASKHFSIDYTSALQPLCILFPERGPGPGVHPVRQHRDLRRPGGQKPKHYFANVGSGRLIFTKHLNEVIYSKATETVPVGPGNRWEDAAKNLEGTDYSAVDGRIGNVGVNGYLRGESPLMNAVQSLVCTEPCC